MKNGPAIGRKFEQRENCGGQIHSARAFQSQGSRKMDTFCGTDQKQLDDLAIAITKVEE